MNKMVEPSGTLAKKARSLAVVSVAPVASIVDGTLVPVLDVGGVGVGVGVGFGVVVGVGVRVGVGIGVGAGVGATVDAGVVKT